MNPSIFLKFADCVNFLGVHSLQLLYPPTVCEKSFCILTNQSSCASSAGYRIASKIDVDHMQQISHIK
ncbi:unnamed protein product [Lactuca virosa]|uniref:Uncharacterized protein n=1 Tax=Lactuca virosa TaxID=75947 RepID=A0AAU9LL12_9ASTR|nr:unnamed protein product [Lactuca virosa]